MLIEKYNYGKNNYSEGMELVILDSTSTIEEVLNSDEYFLNPNAEWNELDHFAFKGTKEQYDILYKNQVKSWIAKRMVNDPRYPWNAETDEEIKLYESLKEEYTKAYKDWWL